MALNFSQLESITNDYFAMDGGSATDIYFNSSFLLNFLLKQQKGLWERPAGGLHIRVPLKYDGNEAGFYKRGDTLNSDKRDNVNAARFDWKHAYGNATILRLDTLENAGPEAVVKLVMDEVETGQNSLVKVLAQSLYDLPGGDTSRLTGLRALCNTTTSTQYGLIAEDDLVAKDGTKPWTGRMVATAQALTLNTIRTACTTAKIRDGVNGKPDMGVMPETLYNKLVDQLTVMQRYTSSETTAKAGFMGINFEGKDITPDDYCPASHMFMLNTKFIGFAVHKEGYFMRGPWRVLEGSPEDKTMKIYFDGNLICSNRKGHIGYSALS